jgi:cytochrome c oxidase subunit 3
LNTALLLTTGLTMALAERRASGGQRQATLLWLAATLLIGVVFLAIKGYEWHHEYTAKLMPVLGLPFDYPDANPQRAELFFNFYYVLTGLHALHMTIGLGLLATVGVLVWRWREPSRNARQVQISGLYWAFVDALWVVVYTLLYLLRG